MSFGESSQNMVEAGSAGNEARIMGNDILKYTWRYIDAALWMEDIYDPAMGTLVASDTKKAAACLGLLETHIHIFRVGSWGKSHSWKFCIVFAVEANRMYSILSTSEHTEIWELGKFNLEVMSLMRDHYKRLIMQK